MKARSWLTLGALLAAVLAAAPAVADEKPFSELVGPVKVGEVQKGDTLQVPYILWGGDVATFIANGGVDTQPNTLFAKQGLKLHLTDGNDFVQQVHDYMEGKSPFLRGTMSMICQAAEVLGQDPKTKPVVFLQMTWSNGDHLVGRGFKSDDPLKELKGKTIALQTGGPHVGMLHDCLMTAGLKWSDINVVWTKNVSGPESPPEVFKPKDSKIDACFAITPDMQALTGGLDSVGTGAEGTVPGARVLVSTKNMNGSIADVYACRSDFFEANRGLVEKFTGGYLKACEELADTRKKATAKGNKDPMVTKKYKEYLKLTQDVYGKELIPSEAEADGLIADAEFAFLTLNVYFFKAENWGVSFKEKQRAGLAAAQAIKSISQAVEFGDAGWDYAKLKTDHGLQKDLPTDLTKLPDRNIPVVVGPDKPMTPATTKDTISYFTIPFEADQDEFDEKQYGASFEKAIKDAALFRNAVIAVRGHADLALLLRHFVIASKEKNLLKQEGAAAPFKYTIVQDGSELKLEDTAKVLKLINEWDFSGASENPKRTLLALEELSLARAKKVQNTVMEYAKKHNLTLDKNQLQSVGVGVSEPMVPTPRDKESMAKNRRVEFRIYKVQVEATEVGGF